MNKIEEILKQNRLKYKAEREYLIWNKRQLSRDANIKYSTLMSYCRNEHQPSPEKLLKIARALGITMEQLIQQ